MARERGDEREKRGLVRWLAVALTVACGGACDSESGHGGLVMAFMSTMVLGLKRREQTKEKKTRERGK